jgi:hypothetical protein
VVRWVWPSECGQMSAAPRVMQMRSDGRGQQTRVGVWTNWCTQVVLAKLAWSCGLGQVSVLSQMRAVNGDACGRAGVVRQEHVLWKRESCEVSGNQKPVETVNSLVHQVTKRPQHVGTGRVLNQRDFGPQAVDQSLESLSVSRRSCTCS